MEVILDAAEWLADIDRLVFLLVGDGSENERLRALARERGLPNVRFADPIPFAAVAPLYRRASLGVTTLKALPLAASIRPVRSVACMAAGRPVACASAGEGARLVERRAPASSRRPRMAPRWPALSDGCSPTRPRPRRWGEGGGPMSRLT